MPRKAHALVQDPEHANALGMGLVGHGAVDDDVRADQVGLMRRRQVLAAVAELEIPRDGLERLLDLVEIRLDLRLAPRHLRVGEDVDDVLFGRGR